MRLRWCRESVAPYALAAWKIEGMRWGFITINWCVGVPTLMVYRECDGGWGALVGLGLIGINVHFS